MRRRAVLAALLLTALVPIAARGEVCAQFQACKDDTTKYNMRWIGTSQNVNWNPVTNSAHLTFADYEAVAMFQKAMSVYSTLDRNIPWDQVDYAKPDAQYARHVYWVPQVDVAPDPQHPEPYAYASCQNFLSTNPICWCIAATIRIAVDPNDGSQYACWMKDTWDGTNLGTLGCGTAQLDFLSVMVHELGHSYGLDHVDYPGATMRPHISFADTTMRTPLACERDTLVRRYHDNPAAALQSFAAYRSWGGVDAVWDVEFAELNTKAYHLSYASERGQAWREVAVQPAIGAQHYRVTIPGVSDGLLSITEEQTDQTMLSLGTDVIGTEPPSTPLPEFSVENPDSLMGALMRNSLAMPLNTSTIQSLIFAPDTVMDVARMWAAFKQSRGINALAVDIDSIGGPQMIKPTIYAKQPDGGSVTFMGSSNEERSITGEPMRSDPAKYTNGRVKDPYPDQPYRNLIPTFFILDPAVDPTLSLADQLPWVTSDSWFVSSTPNHLADPNRAVGRFPGQNKTELMAMVIKAANEWDTDATGPIWTLAYAEDYQWNPGVVVDSAVARLRQLPWPSTMSQYRIVDNPTHPMSGAERDAANTTAFTRGGLFVDEFGSVSGGYNPIDFGRVNRGYQMTSLPANHGREPVLCIWACYGANQAGTENPLYGHRPAVQHLMIPGGARAVIGPTGGSLQAGNQSLAPVFHQTHLQHPELGLGYLLQRSTAAAYAADPRDSLLAEYVLLGDPDMKVPYPMPSTVGVALSSPATSVTAWPNPAWSDVGIAWIMPRLDHVQIDVYDVAGRRVEKLMDQQLSPGAHTLSWNPRSRNAGIYFLSVRIGHDLARRRITILK